MYLKNDLLNESVKINNVNIDIYKKQVKQNKRMAMLMHQGQ